MGKTISGLPKQKPYIRTKKHKHNGKVSTGGDSSPSIIIRDYLEHELWNFLLDLKPGDSFPPVNEFASQLLGDSITDLDIPIPTCRACADKTRQSVHEYLKIELLDLEKQPYPEYINS